MPLTVSSKTLSADCKTLTVVFTTTPKDVSVVINEISGQAVNADGSNVVDNTLTITSDNMSLSGVISICQIIAGTPPRNVPIDYVFGSCELDCCVAGLLQSSIDCTCKCSKCDDDLRKAQKIHLLSESARYAVNNLNITDAINKYKTAKSFCDETCGCGC